MTDSAGKGGLSDRPKGRSIHTFVLGPRCLVHETVRVHSGSRMTGRILHTPGDPLLCSSSGLRYRFLLTSNFPFSFLFSPSFLELNSKIHTDRRNNS
ncbi:hypothetical protein BDV39DRAFT_188001 [Aspergillus sergii]|uniref:Uncharacterized protein n=1 Tax=Aspergillus sergii TaxID=1034303 RepID=A0A5N6WHQ1_9EURO|nr:hypothetical protein BDV39DRAFT_188001 [Aspergillus sergii]